MLTNSKEILLQAKKDNCAVLAPDYVDLDSARAYVRAAEKCGKPIILSSAESLKGIMSLKEAAAVGKIVAADVSVPVVLHLDHGEDEAFIKEAIDLGFTSVMIDASMKSFEENVRMTKEIVAYAHPKNVTVEAEIGHVGQGANGTTDSVYTTVEEAVAFYEQTGVDSLAVSIGTAHGIYKGIAKPVLNFERLHELAKALPIPLVLHGGSGSGDDNLHRCATEGISKINIFTDFLLGAMNNINEEQPKDYLALKKVANEGMEKVMEHYFAVFSNNHEEEK
ncbi:MAG: class II fructose-bisphosphate aldolase [Ruthenibacterium sp.]